MKWALLIAALLLLQDRCKKDRDTCPGQNNDSDARQPEHQLIIALDGRYWLRLSRTAGFAASAEQPASAIPCTVPVEGVSCDCLSDVDAGKIAESLIDPTAHGRIVVSLDRQCFGASPRSQVLLRRCCPEAFSIRD